jgi:hypothetical protein
MKKNERNQMAKIRSCLDIFPTTPSLANYHALICEGILVGDLKITDNSDSGDEAALTRGETNS